MQVASLLTRLTEEQVKSESLADPLADVYTVGFITPGIGTLRDDVLYFGDTTLVDAVELPESPNLVLYGSGGPDVEQRLTHANVCVLADDADPLACYNTLQAYFLEDHEQTAIIRRMLAAHFSNNGLQYLIEEAAMAMGHPLVVVDSTYRYVAHHLAKLEDSNSTLARVMTEEIQNETLLDTALKYIREQGIDSAIARRGGALEHHNEMLDCNTMTGAVMVRGLCMAHVMMMEHDRPFSELDRECFMRLLSFVGQEMQKGEIWGPTSGEMGSYFLTNLIADQHPSETVTRRRLKALNFHPLSTMHVVCLHAPGEGLRQYQAELIAGQLKPMLHHSIYTRYHQNLIVLVSRDDPNDLEQHSSSLLKEVAALNNLSVGISNAFGDITEVRTAYEEARAAVRLGERARDCLDEHRLYWYCNYAYIHLLELASRHTNLLNYCHPALLRLLEHDERHQGELMETLFCFLQVSGTTKRAAEMLNLHKNTLLYRMGRIRAILGFDLASGEDQFMLQLGFRVLMYLGLFAPRFVLDRADLRS